MERIGMLILLATEALSGLVSSVLGVSFGFATGAAEGLGGGLAGFWLMEGIVCSS